MIDGERSNHLRFGDNITLTDKDKIELQGILKELNEKQKNGIKKKMSLII